MSWSGAFQEHQAWASHLPHPPHPAPVHPWRDACRSDRGRTRPTERTAARAGPLLTHNPNRRSLCVPNHMILLILWTIRYLRIRSTDRPCHPHRHTIEPPQPDTAQTCAQSLRRQLPMSGSVAAPKAVADAPCAPRPPARPETAQHRGGTLPEADIRPCRRSARPPCQGRQS